MNEWAPRVAFAGTVLAQEAIVRLRVTGPVGVSGHLQRSLDLRNWTDLASVTCARGPIEISDGGRRTRGSFYRVVIP